MGGRPPLVSGIMDFLARLALAIGRAGSCARGGLAEVSKASIGPPKNREKSSRYEWWGDNFVLRGSSWVDFKSLERFWLGRNVL